MAHTIRGGAARVRMPLSVLAPRTELRCEGCGYGIVIAAQRPLPSCPMCGDLRWLAVERPARKPEPSG